MNRFLRVRAASWCGIGSIAAAGLGMHEVKSQTWIQWSSSAGGNNHYYALTPSATNWDAAEKLALAWGGTLATITSSNEQEFISTTFLTGKFEHLPLWIGLASSPGKSRTSKRLELGGLDAQIGYHPGSNFRWVTGERLSYTNWKPGEPSDTPPGENYVAINWEYSDVPPRGVKGNWNDTPLNGTTGYGGTMDGPYFGLVERDTDPNHPSKGFTKSGPSLRLLTIIVGSIIIGFALFRRHRRLAAS